MPEKLLKESFAELLNTKFRVLLEQDGAPEVELELAELAEFPTLTHSRSDVERFSLYFYGPNEFFLPQRTYRLAHERLGEHDIFLAAVAQEPRGYRYEAVFSYFKDEG
jgi:hypothetical protein